MSDVTTDEGRWVPRLDDAGVFCSPGCGHGCTKNAHDVVQRLATLLAARMGEGWYPHVWENMGWHYSVISPCGRLKVHPNYHSGTMESYTAFLGEPGRGGRWAESGETPEEACKLVVEIAREELAKIKAHIEGLEDWA